MPAVGGERLLSLLAPGIDRMGMPHRVRGARPSPIGAIVHQP